MLALWIILGILAAVCAVGCIPVGVTAVYDAGGAEVLARLGPFRLRLYPKRNEKKSNKEQKSDAEPEKKPETASGQAKPKHSENGFLGGKLSLFRELLGLVLEAQADVRNKLRIRELILCLTVGGKGDDPARAAVLYGSAWTAIGALLPLIESAFRIESRDVQAQIDFLSEETTVYARATAVISIGAILRLAGYYGIRGLKLYQRHTKKGGKINGTSNQ